MPTGQNGSLGGGNNSGGMSMGQTPGYGAGNQLAMTGQGMPPLAMTGQGMPPMGAPGALGGFGAQRAGGGGYGQPQQGGMWGGNSYGSGPQSNPFGGGQASNQVLPSMRGGQLDYRNGAQRPGPGMGQVGEFNGSLAQYPGGDRGGFNPYGMTQQPQAPAYGARPGMTSPGDARAMLGQRLGMPPQGAPQRIEEGVERIGPAPTAAPVASSQSYPVPGYTNPLNSMTAPPGTNGQSNLPPAPAAAPYPVPGYSNPLNAMTAPPGTNGQSNLPMSSVPATPYPVPGYTNPLSQMAPPPPSPWGQPAPAQGLPLSQTALDIMSRLGWR